MTVETRQGQGSGQNLWRESRARNVRERLVRVVLRACAYVSILTTFGIVFVLFGEAFTFFQDVSIVRFLTETQWTAGFATTPEDGEFGIIVLAWATIFSTIIACVVALPIGLGAAIYLSEYASAGLRRWLKPALEILAGVPTIVYGFFALTFVTPFLQGTILPSIQIYNILSASLVMGVMIIPTVASVSEDAIYAVPRGLREGAYALGATKREVATKVVVPAAISGIVASFVLGISRAVGETMIMAVAAGALAQLTVNPLESMQTMTAYIVQVTSGESPRGSLEYETIFAVGATLFVMTLLLNTIAYWFVRRFREVY
ncbi:MAG: phosphate ABC transporter permease subunit PstC [Rubrobacteraceae bacterium]